MRPIKSTLDPRSAEFRANAQAMRGVVADLREKTAHAARGGSEEARAKHLARGKLLPRDRIDALLDPGAPFLELSPLAAYGMYGGEVPSARLITGIGRVSGPRMRDRRERRDGERRHVLSADGEEAPARAGDRAARTACRASTSSIPAARTCPSRTTCSPTATTSAASSTTRRRCPRRASRRSPWSWARAPRVAPTCPRCRTRRSSCRNQGTIFLGGPPLVKAATGEIVTAEELGGADVHTRISGVADHLRRERRARAATSRGASWRT